MLEQFEGAHEAFMLIRQEIVSHAVAHGFGDLPHDQMTRAALGYIDQVMKLMAPRINDACQAASTAGVPADQIRGQITVIMHDLSAVVQDALRECGLNIKIVSYEDPHRGARDGQA